ncbi:MAG: hypothetical protein AMJ69_11075 [Gammaproteobacteria bacterium SG8_47]|nr:MAG: hypothetical protein AMJ69_11075 [Gammaproteobacteria bacterium SG8_47]
MDLAANVRVVLVETSHPGNIGAAARAMKNMCLEELYLVRPHVYPHAEASARASGADDILARARVCETLEQAVRGCSLVVGASARQRTIAWPVLTPRELAARMILASPAEPSALVLGRESSGLTNAELERCNFLVHIPANPAYSSLNLAAAVQVLAYELFVAADAGLSPPVSDSEQEALASHEELEGFYAHLEQTLHQIAFLDPDNPRQLMRRLRRLYGRAGLKRMELNILRGILAATQRQSANQRRGS